MVETNDNKVILTLEETAELYCCTTQTIKNWKEAGILNWVPKGPKEMQGWFIELKKDEYQRQINLQPLKLGKNNK